MNVCPLLALIGAGLTIAGPPITPVFVEGTEGVACWRIPALVGCHPHRMLHGSGVLLAFAEARLTSCDDETNKPLVVKRSTDGGASWSPAAIIAGSNGRDVGFGEDGPPLLHVGSSISRELRLSLL